MPDGPTPPNGSLLLANWKSRWLTTMPPAETSLITRSRMLLALVNRYAASGLGRELTNSIAPSRFSTVTIGRIGPKISSVINGSSGSGSTTTVGWIEIDAASEPPPTAMVPLVAASADGQPVEVALVDDALAAGVVGLECRHGVFDLVDELVADLRIGEHVVRRDADLAGVDQLGPCDPLGGDVDVGVLGDDDRALAAQFQRDRRQVCGGALVHLAADLGPAGEQQPVEALGDQFLADRAVTLDDRDRVVVQILRHQLGHQGGRRRRHLRRFEHHGVSRRDGGDSRARASARTGSSTRR